MKCEQAIPLLDAYLDGELELTGCTEMEAHLETCAACQKRLEETRELVALLKEEAPRFEAPGFLETRIRARLREVEGDVQENAGETARWAGRRQNGVTTARTRLAARMKQAIEEPILPWWQWLFKSGWGMSGAMGATLAIVMFAVIFSRGGEADRRLGEEAIASHVRSLQAAHLMDVASTDRHTVKPWFAGKLDFSPAVIDLKDEGYPLLGGRLDVLDHREVAALVYQRRKHYINLFIWPASGAGKAQNFQTDGYRVRGWTAGGMNYLAVSEIGNDELGDFAAAISERVARTVGE